MSNLLNKEIVIKRLEGGCFDIIIGDRSTEQVTYDEMLGIITQLTMPENKRCLDWFKTKEQHEAFRDRSFNSNNKI